MAFCLQVLPDLRALTKLENLSLSHMQCPLLQPANLSRLATLPASIRTVDLSHVGHAFVPRSIAGLALQPKLERVKIRHCQPLVGNLGNDLPMYASPPLNPLGLA